MVAPLDKALSQKYQFLVEESVKIQKQQLDSGLPVQPIPFVTLAAQAAFWFENPTANPATPGVFDAVTQEVAINLFNKYPTLSRRATLDDEQQIVSSVNRTRKANAPVLPGKKGSKKGAKK